MGIVVFSDVHADASAIAALRMWIKKPAFSNHFGTIDGVVNLGDILHRGNHPGEALEIIHTLSKEFRLVSIMGNHDHAFLNGIQVSGSDAASTYRHEQIRGSPLLSIFTGIPMEWVCSDMLFVHGGPLDLDSSTLHLKCWQRLDRVAGDFFTGYHYTPEMAFLALRSRGLVHMCCGHQHTSLCCQKTPEGIKKTALEYSAVVNGGQDLNGLQVAQVSLDMPSLMRIGACSGEHMEFAFTDFKSFNFIRVI
ncbi:MAG: metallophosphoesterase [Methanoregula sp.]|nr:MAG: metallophosphoesterase [Methanoregula sp.]